MAGMNEKDYYAILEVEETATTDEIRRAFQQKARKLHPDVNKEPDAEERFKEVSEAYAVLSDDDKRRRYDAMRSGAPFAGASAGAGYGGGYGGYTTGDPFGWGFGFPFGQTGYTRRQASQTSSRGYNPKAGADVSYEVTLDDETAAKGARRGITFQRYATCEACAGKGSVHSEHPETCPTCSGRGRITVDLSDFLFGVMEMTCPECSGSGRVVADPCAQCGGSGRVLTATELVVDIPAHSHDGDVVRIAGKGNAGTNGEATGDFVCRVGVPSEQLAPGAQMAFRMLGVMLPFLLINGSLTVADLLTMAGITGIAVVAVGIISGGLRHGLYWWRNAGRSILSGIYTVLPFVIFWLFLSSCNALMFGRFR